MIKAHKFVLSISSPVFEAMFYGELAETRDSIELPDCEYESLLELFRYMYSDEVNLSGSNVMGVLYLAKKYMVPSLADKCSEYLQGKLDASNVFSILPSAQQYEEKNLVDRCWKVIDEQAEKAVKSDGFATIERSLLEAVVERDTLNIEEVELFKAVNLWATKKCEEQGLSADGGENRRILGERIVKGIRFPVMKPEQFAASVLDTNLLTPDEAYVIVKYLHSVLDTPVGFPEKERSCVQRCRRFSLVGLTDSGYTYKHDGKDCVCFTVDKDISLLGVTLCGSESVEYSVDISVKNLDTNECLSRKSGTFLSVPVKSKPVSYYGYNILFDHPVLLNRAVRYNVEAHISGANSCLGVYGKEDVASSGINFHFRTCCSSNNGTDEKRGQFPEFLFTVV